MSTIPVVSIVIPTKNRLELLKRQIAAVRAQVTSFPWEMVVVDNGSSDGTAEFVRDLGLQDPRIRLLTAAAKGDAGYARNRGAEVAIADLIAFVDDDDVVGVGWLEALVADLESHRMVACTIDYELLNPPSIRDGWPMTQTRSLTTVYGVPASTGHVGMHRSLWDQLGGQVEGRLIGEDMEMSIRATREFGTPVHLSRGSIYHRQLPQTLGAAYRQGRRDGRGRVEWRLEEPVTSRLQEWVSAAHRMWWLLSRLPNAARGRRRFVWTYRLGEFVGHERQLLVAMHEQGGESHRVG